MSHLHEELLTRLAAGTIEGAELAAAREHLDGCGDCQRALEEASALVHAKTLAAPISDHPRPVETRPDSPSAHQAEPLRALHQGATLGRYVLLERLGAGGMGEVFSAYDPQLDRKVALKLLRTGTVSATEGRARLLREAQAMARLQHPNVVAVHDVGTLGDRVFVAMEFVEGETAGQWMRSPHSWEETLRMFYEAGTGLSAAHRAGIVHRDFKPDNIIIGRDGRPRVLDFGLARQASSHDLLPAGGDTVVDTPLGAPLTRDGAVMGTPGYMAPEQLGGLPTDARSDQFSFCVALYEALYGKRPFGGATLKAHAELMVQNQLPPPPAAHPAPPFVWNALKRGLAADPAARFPDMEALLAEIKPVRAGPRPARLFGAVVALGVVAALGIGTSIWSTQRLRVCGGSERELAGLWDASTKARLKAAFSKVPVAFADEAFKGVETALDAYTQSWVAAQKDACEAVRIRKTDSEELHGRKSVCLQTRLKQLRALLVVLESPDKVVVSNAVAAARGLDAIDECRDVAVLTLHGAPKGPQELEREELLRSRIIEAKTLHDAGKYARGVEAAKLAIAGGGSPAGLAEAQLLLGRLLTRAGDVKAAEQAYLEAAARAEESGDPALSARAFSRLAATFAVQEQFDAASPWSRLARAAAERLGNNPDVEAELASNTGDVALKENRPRDAKKEFERALRIREGILPPGHPDLAMTYNNLGTAQARLFDWEGAARSYEKSLELHLTYEGREHPNTASSMHNLAFVYRKLGRISEALNFLKQALDIRLATLGPEHTDVASTHITIAKLYDRLQKPEPALEHFKQALAIREKALGADSAPVASVRLEMADLYFAEGAYLEALGHAQTALAIDEKLLGPKHHTTSGARETVGAIYMKLGQWEKSATALNTALEARREKSGPESESIARSLNALADLQYEQRHYEKALGLFEQALAMRERTVESGSLLLANDLLGQGKCYLGLGAPERAVPLLERALKLREKDDDAAELAEARFELARALWEQGGERARAEELASQASTDLRGTLKREAQRWLTARAPSNAPAP